MNKLIIIRGPLGIGKTTISKVLAEKLNANYISIDEVLSENNLDNIDPNIGSISEDNFLKANQIIIKNILKNNKSAVVDGNFYFQNQIENLIQNIPFKSFIFTLTAPLEICLNRDFKRQKPYGPTATTEVYCLVAKLNYGKSIDITNLSTEEIISIVENNL